MSTNIRPEISKNNSYWISKERYYELIHFCRQYPEWKREYDNVSLIISSQTDSDIIQKSDIDDPVSKAVECKLYFRDRMDMVDNTMYETCSWLKDRLFEGIIFGKSYEVMNAYSIMPCSKDFYYKMYREFFWNLNAVRK